MWLFADDPRYQLANQKFVTQILGANTGLTDTERNIFLNNWQQVTGQVQSMINAQTQGFQSRST
jgi:menaquinone-dependent protoporphyrinogen IX oxidase